MTIADRLKQRRLQYGRDAGFEDGYLQEQIAAACGVGQPFYSLCENGYQRLPMFRMIMLANFYGKPIEEAFPEFRPTPRERMLAGILREPAK